jgi:hypothetical protein
MRRRSLLLTLALITLAGGVLFSVARRGAFGERVVTLQPVTDLTPVDVTDAPTLGESTVARSVEVARRRSDVESAVEHEPPETGAFLRIVDADGVAAAGYSLVVGLAMSRDAGVAGRREFTTDARGELDLAPLLGGLSTPPQVDPAGTLVVLGAIDELEPSVLPRSALGVTRAEAAVVVRTPRAVAPLRGVAVDAATGAPLSDYPMRMISWTDLRTPTPPPGVELTRPEALRSVHRMGPSVGEWLTTDAVGRFESRTALPSSRVHFITYDKLHIEAEHQVEEPGRAGELRLEIDAGPIVLLDFDPPAGYARTDFIAALRRDGDEHPAYIGELLWPGDADGGQRPGTAGNAGPVRDGTPPWVRLPRAEVASQELPTHLVLESRDRHCFGSALFEDFERHATRPLRVELATRDVLELRVEWPADGADGHALERLLVTLTPVNAGTEAEPTVAEWVSRWSHEPVTSTRLLGFVPGRHRLAAGTHNLPFDAAQAVPQELDVELPREEPIVLTPRLAEPDSTHELQLVVRTASGEALDGREGRAHLAGFQVRPRGDAGSITWSGGVGRIALRDVPEGPTQVVPYWSRGWFPLEPNDPKFEVPGEPPVLLVRDDRPAEEIVVRVIEPRSDGRVSIVLRSEKQPTHLSSRFGPDDVVDLPDGRRAFVLSSGPFAAVGVVASVELTMEGHEREWRAGSELPAADSAGQRIVELVPRPGWSARIHVLTALADGAAPSVAAPGVVLAFDGLGAPAADDRGLVVHRAANAPTHIALVTPGWQLVPRTSYLGRGTVQADGRVTFEDGELTVLVRRAP